MSVEREYEIVLQPEPEGGYSVFVPELPSVATQGETIEEAAEMAREPSRPTSKSCTKTASPSHPSTAAGSQSTWRERQAPGDRCKQVIATLKTVAEIRRVPHMANHRHETCAILVEDLHPLA